MEDGPRRLSCALSPRPRPSPGGLLRGDSLLVPCPSPPQGEDGEGGRPVEVPRRWALFPSPQHRLQQRGQRSSEPGLPRPGVPLWENPGWRLLDEGGEDQQGRLAGV